MVNAKKVYRIYSELGLPLRHRAPKRQVKAKLRDDRQVATRPNETWPWTSSTTNLRRVRSCAF